MSMLPIMFYHTSISLQTPFINMHYCCSSNLTQLLPLCVIQQLKVDKFNKPPPSTLQSILDTYNDVFIVPHCLPPLCPIHLSIDLIPYVSLPNYPTYYFSMVEHNEIEKLF
jgi:hypothetical protein